MFYKGRYLWDLFEKRNYLLDIVLFMLSGILFVLCNKYADPVCYMYINEYHDFPFMVICAVCGTMPVFIFAKYFMHILGNISFIKNIILWYSINSLTVFPVHLTIKVLFIPLLSKLGMNNWFCLFLLMFVLTIPIVNIINIYFPFIAGNFSYKKVKN